MSVGKLINYGQDYANVVASGTASNAIVPGQTIEQLQLKLGGTALTKAMITGFKLKANGHTIMDGTGTEIEAVNAYRGIATNAGYLDICFTDDKMDTDFDKHVGAFDSSQGIRNITTELTIAGATAPNVKPILVLSDAQIDSKTGNPVPYAGVVSKLLRYPFSIANGGRLPFVLPFGTPSGAVIKRVHIRHGGNMTGATVKQDSKVVHESLAAENAYMQSRVGRVPQANMYTIDFVIDGSIGKALNTRDAKTLEWLLDFSAADNGFVLVEYLDAVGNL